METPAQILGALAALVLAVAALIRVLGGAFEARFADLRKELAQVRTELETERRLRIAAQEKASAADKRAEAAEAEVASLLIVNERMRHEIELMRAALVGSEAERNEALRELAWRADDDARRRRALSTEDTGPRPVAK